MYYLELMCCPLFCVDAVPFSDQLSKYGLTLEVLSDLFTRDKASWSLHEIPNVEFYRLFHRFLKIWGITRHLSQTAIGKFYLAIDRQLQERRSSPYNTYRFIEQLVCSNMPDSALMPYGLGKQLKHMQAEIDDLNMRVNEQENETSQLKLEFRRIMTILEKQKAKLKI